MSKSSSSQDPSLGGGRFALCFESDAEGWCCDVPVPPGLTLQDVVIERAGGYLQIMAVKTSRRDAPAGGRPAEEVTEYRTRLRWPDEDESLRLETALDGELLRLRIRRPSGWTKVVKEARQQWAHWVSAARGR